jgi:signal peptidase II
MIISPNSRSYTLLIWVLFLTIPCYLVDQLTKRIINTHLSIGQGFTVIPGFFDIIHMRNTGAAFGMLQGLPETYRTLFFATITITACAAVFFIFWSMKDTSWIIKAVFSLIIAGALGNLTDRFLFSEVVDFLSFHIGRYRWPTFNMADTYITAGMIGLLIYSFLMQKKI